MKTWHKERYVQRMILRSALVSVGLLAVLLASYGTENSVNAQDRHPAIINSCDASSSSILVDESITISARVHNRSVGVFGAVMYLEVEYYKDGKYITSFLTDTKRVGKGDRATFTDTTGIGEAGSYTAICYLRRDTGELLDLSDPNHPDASGFSTSPTFTVHSPNSAPEIDSYSPRDRLLTVDVGDRQEFSATASDTDDNLTGVEWTLDGRRQDDDDFSRRGRHESDHSVTFDRSGRYTVEVTFTDAKGETNSHSWNVTVSDPTPTHADLVVRDVTVDRDASPSQFEVGDRVTIRAVVRNIGSGSARSSRLEYYIGNSSPGRRIGDDGVSSLDPGEDDSESIKYTFTEADVGTQHFRLVADSESDVDEENESNNVSLIGPFQVRDRNEAPSATRVEPSSNSVSLEEGTTQEFSARATDSNSNISEWEWFVDDRSKGGQSLSRTGSITRGFSYTFSEAGEYQVKATFTDSDGASDSVSWNVTVSEVSAQPGDRKATLNSCEVSRSSVPAGETISLSARATNNSAGMFSAKLRVNFEFYDRAGDYTGILQTSWETVRKGDSYLFSETAEAGGRYLSEGKNTIICYLWWDRSSSELDRTGSDRDLSHPTVIVTHHTDHLPANEAPSATRVEPSSGSVSLEAGATQEFSARATDSNSDISGWEWFVDDRSKGGQSLSRTGSITRRFSYTFSEAGEYQVKVTFTDAEGASDSVSWEVTVSGSTHPDLVVRDVTVDRDASPSQFTVGDMVAIRANVRNIGSGSAGRSKLAYYIGSSSAGRKIGDDSVESLDPGRNDGETMTYTFTDADVGTQYFRLVADSNSNIDEENEGNNTILIGPFQVLARNEAPSATRVSPASDSVSLEEGAAQEFSARATDSNSNISGWEWFVDDQSKGGQSLSRTGSITRRFSYTFSGAGEYRVKATFTDANGASDSVSWEVIVSGSTQPDLVVRDVTVDLDPSPSQFTVGDMVAIRANVRNIGSDSAGRSKLAYYIGSSSVGRKIGDDSVESLDPGRNDGETMTYTFTDADVGTQYFRLVADSNSNIDEENEGNNVGLIGPFEVHVHNDPPSAIRVGPSSGGVSLEAGAVQDFSARATDSNSNISEVEWFVDGRRKSGSSLSRTGSITRRFSHTFSIAGEYRVKATFTDADGASDSVSWDVTVFDCQAWAHVNISHTNIEDLTVRIGVGEKNPLWEKTIHNRTGDVQNKLSLKMDISDACGDYLFPDLHEHWFLEVTDHARQNEGYIDSFYITLANGRGHGAGRMRISDLATTVARLTFDSNPELLLERSAAMSSALVTLDLARQGQNYDERRVALAFQEIKSQLDEDLLDKVPPQMLEEMDRVVELASVTGHNAVEASSKFIFGAGCGEWCFNHKQDGTNSPFYLAGWLIMGLVPVVDIVTDVRDFGASLFSGSSTDVAANFIGLAPNAICPIACDSVQLVNHVKKIVKRIGDKAKITVVNIFKHIPFAKPVVKKIVPYMYGNLKIAKGLNSEGFDKLIDAIVGVDKIAQRIKLENLDELIGQLERVKNIKGKENAFHRVLKAVQSQDTSGGEYRLLDVVTNRHDPETIVDLNRIVNDKGIDITDQTSRKSDFTDIDVVKGRIDGGKIIEEQYIEVGTAYRKEIADVYDKPGKITRYEALQKEKHVDIAFEFEEMKKTDRNYYRDVQDAKDNMKLLENAGFERKEKGYDFSWIKKSSNVPTKRSNTSYIKDHYIEDYSWQR